MYILRKTRSEETIAAAKPARKAPVERAAQRRRTRRAIVDAAAGLLARRQSPTVADVAAAADVSRRTVYMYFPTLEQLLVDAALGSMSRDTVDVALDALDSEAISDVEERVDRLARAMQSLAIETEQQGRTIMRLTAEGVSGPGAQSPRRGYRRVEWIERALTPARKQLTRHRFDQLVSALSLVVGFEAFVIQRDIRGLSLENAVEISAWSARALVRAALAEQSSTARRPPSRR